MAAQIEFRNKIKDLYRIGHLSSVLFLLQAGRDRLSILKIISFSFQILNRFSARFRFYKLRWCASAPPIVCTATPALGAVRKESP
jgi:hypothetical protein